MQTHCTATGVQTRQNADHSFAGYHYANHKLWEGRVAAPRAWGNAVEKLRSRQTDLKQRGATAKITAWTKAARRSAANRRLLPNKQQAQTGRRNPEPTLALL
jgi:hypothetical protein